MLFNRYSQDRYSVIPVSGFDNVSTVLYRFFGVFFLAVVLQYPTYVALDILFGKNDGYQRREFLLPLALILNFLIIAVPYCVDLYLKIRLKRTYAKRSEQFIAYADKNNLGLTTDVPLQYLASSMLIKARLDNLSIVRMIIPSSGQWSVSDIKFDVVKKAKNDSYVSAHILQTVLSIDLSREVPNIFFDSKKHRARAFRWLLKSGQNDQLEGNFYKFFKVFVPGDYQIDMRSIVSPDVMIALLDLRNFDVEFAGKKIFIYSHLSRHPEKYMDDFIAKGSKLKKELEDNLNTYMDNRLPYELSKNYIHMDGYKLNVRNKKYWKFAIGLICYVVFFVIMQIIGSGD